MPLVRTSGAAVARLSSQTSEVCVDLDEIQMQCSKSAALQKNKKSVNFAEKHFVELSTDVIR